MPYVNFIYKWVAGIFPRGYGRPVCRADKLTTCADCLEIWEHQSPGNLRACPGL